MKNLNVRRLSLYVLIVSVAVSALIGVGIMLFGDFGEFETKILLTTLTITVTSVLGLACGACLEAGKGRILPIAGIVFAIAAAVLWIVLLWSPFQRDAHYFPHFVMSATLLAFSCSHISLLSLATLDRRFAWSRIAVHIFVWTLTGLTLYIIWWHVDPSDTMLARIMGVLSILIGALTVVTPVFHRLSSSEDDAAKIDAEIEKLSKRLAELEAKKAAHAGDPAEVQAE
ncbi:MAG: hypothetical protein IPM25_12440 [Chloracidobacterium sp.]|nr:hypothetical protein [Chloracidobacterium sp.]